MQRSIIIYFFMLISIGVGYLAILPPFEGFDENAHYSSIRQIASKHQIPIYGKSYLDTITTLYQGPVHYDSMSPPFDNNMVYAKFFQNPKRVDDYIKIYRQSIPPKDYIASKSLNWQAQHPPLYYILMSSVSKWINNYSFVTQIFLMRIFSYMLVLFGVALGMLALVIQPQHLKRATFIGFIFYPILLPMFFLEFTRIGNDALCILLVGMLAFLMSSWTFGNRKNINGVFIGIVLGLGFFVKAFFLPISVAASLFLLINIWRSSGGGQPRITQTLSFLIPLCLISIGWYLYQYYFLGGITSSADSATLVSQGGLLTNLQLHFSFFELLRGLLATVVTFIWAGSWSLVRLHWVLYLPLIALLVWIVLVYLVKLFKTPITKYLWLPFYLIACFSFGLVAHIIISLALLSTGNTPGWYLHILMPFTATLIGTGVLKIYQSKFRALLNILLIYSFIFQIIAIWSQISLYAGCATKGTDKYFNFTQPYFCLSNVPTMLTNLSVIGWPFLAFICFSIGLILAILLVNTITKLPLKNS